VPILISYVMLCYVIITLNCLIVHAVSVSCSAWRVLALCECSSSSSHCAGLLTDVDLYFAPFDNVFVVNVDPVTGVHSISIDPMYHYTRHDTDPSTSSHRSRRHVDTNSTSSNSTDDVYELTERTASRLVTFVAVTHSNMFLVVRGVANRLVLMLPNTAHRLKVSRFYLVVAGASNTSHGIVYFRQDQPHIDLFVFFSVFFSCFFLFLAACVLMWKAKQAVDRRRSRHRRQIEMHDMASRPFASALVYMRDHQHQREDHHWDDPPLRLCPLAVEPTRGAAAVVATFMVELPCVGAGPVRACLGSCLLTSRVTHSSHYVSVKTTGGAGSTSVT